MPKDFTHLHVHSDASTLDGANSVDQLIGRARDMGMKAMAITDHGVLYNAFAFHEKATKAGIKPIIGMEAYVAPAARQDKESLTPLGKRNYHLVLLAQTPEGYKNLVKLSSLGFREGMHYGKARVDREILERHSEGLIATSACMAGEVGQKLTIAREAKARGDEAGYRSAGEAVMEAVRWHKRVFGDRYYLETQAHDTPGQKELNSDIFKIGEKLGIPVIVTTDAHFLTAASHEAQGCLVCMGTGMKMDDPKRMAYDKGLYLQSGDEVAAFMGRTDVLDRTMEIADRVNLSFRKQYHVPGFPLETEQKAAARAAVGQKGGARQVLSEKILSDESLGQEALEARAEEVEALRLMAEKGMAERYGDRITQEIRDRLAYELGVISNAGYAGYYLIVEDFIRYARSIKVPVGPGRGSAAGSLVSYCLRITDVDPIEYDLLFERFLNPERVSMPDIDIDFSRDGREKVIDYVRQKYGESAVCQIVTFSTLKARRVVKDVGRTMGFEPGEMDKFAKLIPNEANNSLTLAEAIRQVPEIARLYREEPRWKKLMDMALQLEGLKSNPSVHASGVLIAPGPVEDYVPVSYSKDGSLIAQYDMNDLEKSGMLKIDFLGLETLNVIADTLESVRADTGEEIDLDKLGLDDAETYRMLAEGKVAGVFQMESSLAKRALATIRPTRLEDLVATNALIRPGPLEQGMVDVYARRKRGQEAVTYPHPALEPILKTTYGVIAYQEQVMRAAQILAGYSLAQADMMRKAIGKKDDELLAREIGRFREMAVKGGKCTPEQAKEIAGLIETFGRYGFNKSHGVAYALLIYRTAWLKRHYPAHYMAALLSSVMDEAKDVIKYLDEAKRMRVPVLAPSVNESGVKFKVVDKNGQRAIRFGLVAIRKIGETAAQAIISARAQKPFADFFDFVQRVHDTGGISVTAVSALVEAGALDDLGPSRAAMLAVIPVLKKEQERLRKAAGKEKKKPETVADFAALFATDRKEEPEEVAMEGTTTARVPWPDVEEIPQEEKMALERAAIGVVVSGNPLEKYRDQVEALATHRASDLAEMKNGRVKIAGVVTGVKEWLAKKTQKKTAKFTLEDLTGQIPSIAFSREVERYGDLLKEGSMVVIEGTLTEDMRDENARGDVRVDKVTALAEALNAEEVTVAIRINAQIRQDQSSMERIGKILSETPGKSPVIIEDEGPPKAARTAKSTVKPTPEVVSALREVVGAEKVSVRKAPRPQAAGRPGNWKGAGRSK